MITLARYSLMTMLRRDQYIPARMSIYEIVVKDHKGNDVPVESLIKGKVALIVNVASKCGFTKQYTGLQQLQDKFGGQDFTVVGFPCNQFGNQEPGTDEEIQTNVCQLYKTTFPIMKKIEVNGSNEHPLYAHLKKEKPGILGSKGIKWNFTKFLVDKNGKVIERYAPTTNPDSIEDDIKKLL